MMMMMMMMMVSALFIDVGTNYSVLDHTNLSFIYEDVLSPGPNADGEFVSNELFNTLPLLMKQEAQLLLI